jgi:hypothetical protein
MPGFAIGQSLLMKEAQPSCHAALVRTLVVGFYGGKTALHSTAQSRTT